MAEPLHAFIHNISRWPLLAQTRAAQSSAFRAARSKCPIRISSGRTNHQSCRRSAKDLCCVNDESEISEVVRRRLFEDLGSERIRKNVATGLCGLVLRKTGATSAASGRLWIPPRPRPRRANILQRPLRGLLSVSSRDAVGVSSANGKRFRNTSRRAERWRCSPSGFHGLFGEGLRTGSARTVNHLGLGSARGARFPQRWSWDSSASRVSVAAIDSDIAGEYSHARGVGRGYERPSPGDPPACRHRLSCSSHRVGRSTRLRICPSFASLSGNRRWTLRRWITPRYTLESRSLLHKRAGRTASKSIQGDDEEGGE